MLDGNTDASSRPDGETKSLVVSSFWFRSVVGVEAGDLSARWKVCPSHLLFRTPPTDSHNEPAMEATSLNEAIPALLSNYGKATVSQVSQVSQCEPARLRQRHLTPGRDPPPVASFRVIPCPAVSVPDQPTLPLFSPLCVPSALLFSQRCLPSFVFIRKTNMFSKPSHVVVSHPPVAGFS